MKPHVHLSENYYSYTQACLGAVRKLRKHVFDYFWPTKYPSLVVKISKNCTFLTQPSTPICLRNLRTAPKQTVWKNVWSLKKFPLRVTKIQFYSFLLFWSEIRNCHKDSLLSLFWEAKEIISFLPIFWRSDTILTCILHFLNNSLLNFNGSGISKMSVFANLLQWQMTLALLFSFSSLAPNSNRKTRPI